MTNWHSSYNSKSLQYADIFKTIIHLNKPKLIIEFGILNGYSLKAIAETASKSCIIKAYDIFEKFNGNHANKSDLNNKFKEFSNVIIDELDFYKGHLTFDDDSIDILHIDIANDGDTYEHVLEHYLSKVNGVIIMEGGSEERDNVHWMNKYGKTKIGPVLDKYKDIVDIMTFDTFPSMTIITKKK